MRSSRCQLKLRTAIDGNTGTRDGALYNNGTLMASASNDPNGYFHHNPDISNYGDRYQVQYYTLEDLTDLNQENATIDAYLKSAAQQLQSHGVDGFASMR